MNGFATLVQYRDPDTLDTLGELISIDSEDVVIGLTALGVKSVESKTDGKKLITTFIKQEAEEPFQIIQRSLAGVMPSVNIEDLYQKVEIKVAGGGVVALRVLDIYMMFFNRIALARQGWKGQLTLMRSIPIQK